MSFRVLAATALLALPACLNIPAFTPATDGPPGDDDDTSGGTVTLVSGPTGDHTAMGADFTVHFPMFGAQFPDQITRHGDSLLTGGSSTECDQPSGAGIALSPSASVDGFSNPDSDHGSTFTVLANGPSLVEVSIAWESKTSCTSASKGISGRSIYAITPDARIVRFDAIDPPMEVLSSGQCECSLVASMPPWSLRSELSIALPVLTNVVDSSLKPVVFSDTQKQDQIVCGFGAEHSIGFGFQRPQVRVRQPTPMAMIFTYDFQDTPSTILDPGKPIDATSSAYLLGDAQGCAASVSKLDAFSSNPFLKVNGVVNGTGVDGVYGGNDGSNIVGISTQAGVATLSAATQPIPAGFVVWLDFGPNHTRFEVTSTAHVGTDWFTISPATPQGQVIIWFRDELDPADTITVTAENWTESGEPSVTVHSTAGDEAYCPECNRSYSLEHEFCPGDGAKLVILRARPDMFIGRVFDDRYEVRAPLGYGGMGTVYRGWQRSVDREVAIKVIHPKLATDRVAVKRFLREARLSSRLNQPNIINVYDFGQTDDGVLFLVMELLHGSTLGKVLEQSMALPTKRITTIALQLCDALEAAHNQGIIHRDLKPGNIVILDEPPGRDLIKVLDFGLAKSLVADNSRVTHTSVMLGTPLYMPPEQIDGREAEPRSDLYAFGCILHHMATGAPPFVRDHVGAILQAHRHDPVPPMPPSVPAPLRMIIERMLEKDAAARPASASQVRDALQLIAESSMRVLPTGMRLPSAAIPVPPPPTAGFSAMTSGAASLATPPRRRSVLAIAIGLVATLSIAAAIYLAKRDKPPDTQGVSSKSLAGSGTDSSSRPAIDAGIVETRSTADAAIVEATTPIDAATIPIDASSAPPIDAPKHRVQQGTRARTRDAGGELPDLPFQH